MATVSLNWGDVSISGGAQIRRCEIDARKDGDALVMEVYGVERAAASAAGLAGLPPARDYSVTAYYWLADRQSRIPLYDEAEGLRNLEDAQEALARWYAAHAPALLAALAG